MVYLMMGRVGERRAHSRKPARLKAEANPVNANTAGTSSVFGSIG